MLTQRQTDELDVQSTVDSGVQYGRSKAQIDPDWGREDGASQRNGIRTTVKRAMHQVIS